MKFKIARDTLLKSLNLVAGVVERRQTLPILANVLMVLEGEHLSLTGTDLEGNTVEMEGLSTDVLRRQADGIWLLVIDNPYGSAICG